MEVALASQPKPVILPKVSTFEAKLRQELDYDKLLHAISILPSNYSFEVEKTLSRIFDCRRAG